jgi:hypothetical protein
LILQVHYVVPFLGREVGVVVESWGCDEIVVMYIVGISILPVFLDLCIECISLASVIGLW